MSMEINKVKANLNKTVLYNNTEYRLKAYILSYDEKNNTYIHKAELKDMHANSVIVCKLKEVVEKSDNIS